MISSRGLRVSAFVLMTVVLVILPGFASGTVAEKVLALHPGQRIDVTLRDGSHIVGRLEAASQDQFSFTSEGKAHERRQLSYAEVSDVRTKMKKATKWAIAGGVYGVLLVLGLILGN